MRKVRKALQGVAFLAISVGMVLGLVLHTNGKDAIGARAEDTGSTVYNDANNIYALRYSGNEVELLFNADLSVYNNLSKETATSLKDSLINVLKDVVSDDLDLDNLTQNHNGKMLPRRAPGVDTSTLESIINSQLTSIEDVENVTASDGKYDTLLSYYVDRYVGNYVSDNNITDDADKAQVYQDVKDSLVNAISTKVQDVYADEGATPSEITEAVATVTGKVSGIVDEVKTINDNGENVGIDISDVKTIVNSITTADEATLSNVASVINTINVQDEVKTVVTNASSAELTDFLTTVDMSVVSKVVQEVGIDNNDLKDIINVVGPDNLVEIVNQVGVESLKELAQSANLSRADLEELIVDNIASIQLSSITKLINEATFDGHVVYKDGSFVNEGLKYIIKGLPRPHEIASFTDDQMRLSWDVSIGTSFGTAQFDLTVGFFGDCSRIRKVAKYIDDTFEVSKVDGVYNVTINTPSYTDTLLLRLAESEYISDDLKHEIFDTSFLTFEEIYNHIDVKEYVELLRGVDYQQVVNTLTSASELNSIFETDKFTTERIEKLVNDFNKLVSKGSKVTYAKLQEFVNQFKEGALDNATIESYVNRLHNLLVRLADKNIDYNLLRQFAETGTGLDPDGYLADLANDQDRLDKIQKVLDKAYSLIPESEKQNSIMDYYDGNGNFSLSGDYTINFRDILNKLFGSSGEKIYNRISSFLPGESKQISLNVKSSIDGVYSITYHGDTDKVGLLPVGADVAFFGNDDAITSWVLADGTPVTTMPDEDIEVYPGFKVTANGGNDELTFTYDGQAHTITSEITPSDSYTYTYQWTLDGIEIEGATSATYNVTNVDDEGIYKLYVTAAEINVTHESNDVIVTINPAQIDVSGASWNYTDPFTYDGTEKTIILKNIPEGASPSYNGNKGTDAGNYEASVTFTCDENHTIKGEVAKKAWTINKAEVDVSGLTWNYTDPFTYDGNEKSVALNKVPAGLTQNYSGNTATNAGTYEASVTFEADANHTISGEVAKLSWTINPAQIDVSGASWKYTDPLTYDGTEKTIELKNIPEGASPSYTGNKGTDAGDYEASVTFTCDANHTISGEVAKLSWTINKAPIDVSGATWKYTDPFTYDGTEKSVTLDSIPAGVAPTYAGNTGTNAGTYEASVTFETDTNHTISGEVAKLPWTINPAPIDVSGATWNYKDPFTYDGTEKSVTLDNIPAGVSPSYAGNTGTNAGTYEASVTFETDANHTVSGEVAKLSWTIDQASIDLSTLTWDYVAPFEYDGTAHKVELAETIANVTFTYSNNEKTDAGSYTATAEASVSDPNYKLVNSIPSVDWIINAISYDLSSLAWDYSVAIEYDGNAHTITLKDVPSFLTITYSGNTATEAGQYTATATASANQNYELSGQISALNWEIKKTTTPVEPVTVLKYTDANGNVIAEVTVLDGGEFPGTYQLQVEPQAFDSSLDYKSILGRGQKVEGGTPYELFFNDNGSRVTVPNGKYRVKLMIPSDLVDYPDDRLKVVYIDDSGKVAESFEFTRVGNYVEFETTHFSLYAVLGISKPANLWWIWLIVLAVILLILLLILLLRKKYSLIEVYKESGKIFVDGVEVVAPAAEYETVELYKENGKIFVNGVEVKDDDTTLPPEGQFEVIELYKESGDIYLNGNKEDAEDTIVVEKETGNTFINNEEVDYSYYNNLNHSYKARLIRTNDKTKEYYSAIKNEILSYRNGKKEVSNRTSWKHETFSSGREQLVELKMRRTALVVLLPLNFADYVDTKYRVDDNGDGRVAFVIRNDRRCKYAKDLIATVMANAGLTKVEQAEVDYTAELETKSIDALVNEGLIKK